MCGTAFVPDLRIGHNCRRDAVRQQKVEKSSYAKELESKMTFELKALTEDVMELITKKQLKMNGRRLRRNKCGLWFVVLDGRRDAVRQQKVEKSSYAKELESKMTFELKALTEDVMELITKKQLKMNGRRLRRNKCGLWFVVLDGRIGGSRFDERSSETAQDVERTRRGRQKGSLLSFHIIDPERLTFLFSKKLQKSDVGVLKRLCFLSLTDINLNIIQTHILPRLDGSSLTNTSAVSSELQSLCSDDDLWSPISKSTWPSITDPRVDNIISTFPGGHRSFYKDSFGALFTEL
nr:F-box protein At2g27310-like [Tanacetum cinerariifolium]